MIVSAPGKIHLIGEHAVVYGKPAIIAAIGKKTFVTIEPSKNIVFQDLSWLNFYQEWKIKEILKITEDTLLLYKKSFLKNDFTQFFHFIKENNYQRYWASLLGIAMKMLKVNEGFSIKIESQIPIGAGLGSSASKAVAIDKAIAKFFQKKVSLRKINEIAFEQEKIIHLRPSGGDNSSCCFGGLIWFKKEKPKEKIESLKKEIPYKLKNFILVYTGKPEKTTGELVEAVRKLNKEYRDKRIKRIGELSFELRSALREKNFERMKEIINEAQKNLVELGVSTKKIDEISKRVKGIGGAAKLSGAGGGGVMLCYHEDKEKLIDLIKNMGYEPWETELGVEGVKVEDKKF
jgi:mevalonate kinase